MKKLFEKFKALETWKKVAIVVAIAIIGFTIAANIRDAILGAPEPETGIETGIGAEVGAEVEGVNPQFTRYVDTDTDRDKD